MYTCIHVYMYTCVYIMITIIIIIEREREIEIGPAASFEDLTSGGIDAALMCIYIYI